MGSEDVDKSDEYSRSRLGSQGVAGASFGPIPANGALSHHQNDDLASCWKRWVSMSGSMPSLSREAQFSSSSFNEDAVSSLSSLENHFGDLFEGRQLAIQAVDFGTKGTWYRVRLPADSLAGAERVCASIKASGGDCIVSGP